MDIRRSLCRPQENIQEGFPRKLCGRLHAAENCKYVDRDAMFANIDIYYATPGMLFPVILEKKSG